MARVRFHEAQPAVGAFPAPTPRSPSPVLVPVQQAAWLGVSAAALILALAVGAGFFSLVRLEADGPRMAPLSRYPWRAVGAAAAFGCPLLGLGAFGWHLWDRLRWDIREPMERRVLTLGDPSEAAAPPHPTPP